MTNEAQILGESIFQLAPVAVPFTVNGDTANGGEKADQSMGETYVFAF